MKKRANVTAAIVSLVLSASLAGEEPTAIEKFAAAFIDAEIAAWERGEFDALQALEHSDVVFQNINGTVFRGWDEHKKAIEETKAGYNGARITQEWRYLMGEGNMFAVSYVWTVHFPQQPLRIAGIAVGRVRDGKLAEEWGAGSALPPTAD
jgi:hypothetical protein